MHENESVTQVLQKCWQSCIFPDSTDGSLSGHHRKAHLILRRMDRISLFCRSLLRSGFIQSRTESMPYMLCRSDDTRPGGTLWHSSLHETRLACLEKVISVQRNIYGKSKLRWDSTFGLQPGCSFSKPKWLWDCERRFRCFFPFLSFLEFSKRWQPRIGRIDFVFVYFCSLFLLKGRHYWRTVYECKNLTAWCCRTPNQVPWSSFCKHISWNT